MSAAHCDFPFFEEVKSCVCGICVYFDSRRKKKEERRLKVVCVVFVCILCKNGDFSLVTNTTLVCVFSN